MASIQADTIVGFNAYVDGLRDDGIFFTHLQFDTSGINKICVDQPSKEVAKMDTFHPGGGTPLIDAAYKTIKAVESAVALKPADKVVITIMTDGEENASNQYTYKDLSLLIKEKTDLGWEFNFLGAGIDTYAQSAKMGLSAAQTMSYDSSDHKKTVYAYSGRGSATRAFASGLSSSMGISDLEKMCAGDAYAGLSSVTPVATTVTKPATVATPAVAPSTASPKPTKRAIIEDVVL